MCAKVDNRGVLRQRLEDVKIRTPPAHGWAVGVGRGGSHGQGSPAGLTLTVPLPGDRPGPLARGCYEPSPRQRQLRCWRLGGDGLSSLPAGVGERGRVWGSDPCQITCSSPRERAARPNNISLQLVRLRVRSVENCNTWAPEPSSVAHLNMCLVSTPCCMTGVYLRSAIGQF
jgi:hypothetical protein